MVIEEEGLNNPYLNKVEIMYSSVAKALFRKLQKHLTDKEKQPFYNRVY